MSTMTPDDLLSEFMDKEIIVSLSNHSYSSSSTFSASVPHYKGKLINYNNKFIILMSNNKKILINIDAIVTIEEKK